MKEKYSTISFNNLKAYWLTLARKSEGICQNTTEALIITTGAGNVLMNPIFLEKDAKLPSIVNCRHQHSFWWDNHRNANLTTSQYDYEILMGKVPMMVKRLNAEHSVILPENIEIQVLADNSDLSSWMEPVTKCFDMDDITTTAYQKALESAPDKFVHVCAVDKGKMIATGSIFLHSNSAGFYNLAVLPEYRR